MAQSASLAESKAIQARSNLEKYVFGTAVSTVPPVISPQLPASVAKYPSFPYTSSPTQWNEGTAPIAFYSAGSTSLYNVYSLFEYASNTKKSRFGSFL
jgi:hypothetical protein